MQPPWTEPLDDITIRPRRSVAPVHTPPSWPGAAILLVPLAAAQDALARLDARAQAAPVPVREGLIARLAFREAAGWMAAEYAWVHPHDLALRDLALTGGFDAAIRGGVARRALPNTLASGHAGWTDTKDPFASLRDEAGVAPALHLARLLRHLPRRHDPLADPHTAMTVLRPLNPGSATEFDAVRFARWRAALTGYNARVDRIILDGRPALDAEAQRTPSPPLPALLIAAAAAQGWMEDGILDQPSAAQALAIAALYLARTGTLRVLPLPVWTAWPAIGQPDPEGLPGRGGLPQLRRSAMERLGLVSRDADGWPGHFLALVAESAQAGLRELDRLVDAAQRGAAFTANSDRRSRLPEALDAALRTPALTSKALARQLHVTPQAATRLLAILAEAGILAEITGRKSFRAFAVVANLTPLGAEQSEAAPLIKRRSRSSDSGGPNH